VVDRLSSYPSRATHVVVCRRRVRVTVADRDRRCNSVCRRPRLLERRHHRLLGAGRFVLDRRSEERWGVGGGLHRVVVGDAPVVRLRRCPSLVVDRRAVVVVVACGRREDVCRSLRRGDVAHHRVGRDLEGRIFGRRSGMRVVVGLSLSIRRWVRHLRCHPQVLGVMPASDPVHSDGQVHVSLQSGGCLPRA
jgi:hypothetical protein